mgnify:CR=1 FL=1
MSIALSQPVPQSVARVKKFGFYAPKTVDSPITVGGKITGLSGGGTWDVSAGSEVTIDSRTISFPLDHSGLIVFVKKCWIGLGKPAVKLRLYFDGSLVDEVDVSEYNVVNKILSVIMITAGEHTIELRVYNPSSSASQFLIGNDGCVDYVYGLAIYDLVETTIYSITLPDYTLIDGGGGDFRYQVGVYVRVVAYRRTTSDAYMNSNRQYLKTYSNDYSSTLGDNVIPAGTDIDNPVNIHLGFAYPSDKVLNITGWVTSDGDVIVLTEIYYQVTLIGNKVTLYNTIANFISNSKGLHYFLVRAVGFPSNTSVQVYLGDDNIESDILVVSSSGGSDVVYVSSPVPNMSYLGLYAGNSAYNIMKACIIVVEVVSIE